MRIIRCYVYDQNKTHNFFDLLIEYVNQHNIENITILKSYYRGFNIEITCPQENIDFENYLKKILKENTTKYDEKSYEAFERKIHTVMLMDEYEGKMPSLYKDGEITIQKSTIYNNLKNVCDNDVYIEIERLKTKLLCSIYNKWKSLSQEEQNTEILKMFLISSSLSPDGIKFGYISLRSNYEYFKQQLLEVKNKEKAEEWRKYIEYRSEIDEKFIDNGVKRFLDEEYDSEFIFSILKKFVNMIKEIYLNALNDKKLYTNKLYVATDFFKRHESASDFHNTFYKSDTIIDLYSQEEFVVYRYIISTLYSLMPLFNVTPLRKQKITGVLAESVENYYSMNWRDVFKEVIAKYGGKAENE